MKIFIFMYFVSIGTLYSQEVRLKYNADSNLVSKNHFNNCIVKMNYADLIPSQSLNENVLFDYFPFDKKYKPACDGIYFYQIVSSSSPSLGYVDEHGRYKKYLVFIVNDKSIVPVSLKTKRWRRRYIKKNINQLAVKHEIEDLELLKQTILNGYKKIY